MSSNEQLQQQVEQLTQERDAALHEVELFRDTLADNEAYCVEMMRARDAARADAERLAAVLSKIAEIIDARDALAAHQRGEG